VKIGYVSEFRRFYKGKNLNLLEDDLPKHIRIRPYKRKYGLYLTPLYEFIQTKIGKNWDDVYSEILTKINKKYRYIIDSDLFEYSWLIQKPIYGEDMIPINEYGRILTDTIFIDFNNILVKKTKEEILSDSLKYKRKEKLLRIGII
jgi:hypothetical protein